MRKKRIKKLVISLCCVISCLGLMGCGASSGNKSIAINSLKAEMTLTHVNYYDFFNEQYVSDYSGTSYVPSSGLSSTTILFLDVTNTTRTVCVNTPLQNKPATVNVYTNYAKTTYDTYVCTY